MLTRLLQLTSAYIFAAIFAEASAISLNNTGCQTNNTIIPNDAAVERAASIPTNNKLCTVGTKFFPQPVHHATFNGNWSDPQATYLQQYTIIDKYYKPGGPVLFYHIPEEPMTCLEGLVFPMWAQELGALAISIEHRYFGLSCPHGLNYSRQATWDPKLMTDLTLENVLADGVAFLTWLKTRAYPAAKYAKVIVFGGCVVRWRCFGLVQNSISGHHVRAIAAAPATKGLFTDPNNSLKFAFMDWVNMVIYDMSALAATKVKRAIQDLRSLVDAEKLNLCTSPNSTAAGNSVVSLAVASYVNAVQYNYASAGFPLDRIINSTLHLNDTLSIIGAAISAKSSVSVSGNGSQPAQPPCTPLPPQQSQRESFSYVICTYLPYPRSSESRNDTVFGANLPDLSASNIKDEDCQRLWGIKAVDGGPDYLQRMGLDQKTLNSTSRLIISQGLFDPVTALGPTAWEPTGDRSHSRVVYFGHTSHTGEFRRELEEDPQALKEGRRYELESIKERLGVV